MSPGPAASSRGTEFRHGSATDRGLVRRVNEDDLLCAYPVFLVADGMGGHAAGDVASAIVVQEFRALVGHGPARKRAVREALRCADQRVRGISGAGAPTAGTTVAGVVAVECDGAPYWLVVNIGDSRVYLLGKEGLQQVSVDHSLVQELVDSGELDPAVVRKHPQRHVVTRAVGSPDGLEPEYWLLPISPGDRLLVCSDGLTGEVEDVGLARQLTGHRDPQAAAEALVALALAAGGRDNVTAVVVDVVGGGAVPEPLEHTTPRREQLSDDTVPRPRNVSV